LQPTMDMPCTINPRVVVEEDYVYEETFSLLTDFFPGQLCRPLGHLGKPERDGCAVDAGNLLVNTYNYTPLSSSPLTQTCLTTYARRMGQPTQRATNYTARSNIDTAQIFLHANGQSAPRSGSARGVGRGAGSHTPSTRPRSPSL